MIDSDWEVTGSDYDDGFEFGKKDRTDIDTFLAEESEEYEKGFWDGFNNAGDS